MSGVVAVALVGAIVAARQGPDTNQNLYQPIATVLDSLDGALPDSRVVRIDSASIDFGAPIVLALRRRHVRADIDFGVQLGRVYEIEERRYPQVIGVRVGDAPAPRGRLVARVDVGPPNPRTVSTFLRTR